MLSSGHSCTATEGLSAALRAKTGETYLSGDMMCATQTGAICLFSSGASWASPPDAVKDLVVVCYSVLVNLPLLRLYPVPLCMQLSISVAMKDNFPRTCGNALAISCTASWGSSRHLRQKSGLHIKTLCMLTLQDTYPISSTLQMDVPSDNLKTVALRETTLAISSS